MTNSKHSCVKVTSRSRQDDLLTDSDNARYSNSVLFYRTTQLWKSCHRTSVRLSVCLSHACFVTKPNNALRIFWYNMKGQSL